ncbi:MAG: F0F1 ATP synthase subunit alpha [Armatimonadota bacterium]|nr:MAG: F0F1 ATP synthase subunit alpha [Armatimonadota bacterium]
MRIEPDEVSSVIRDELERYGAEAETADVGTVIQVGDGIARVYGLSGAMASELIQFPNEVYGIALNLEEDNVGCILLGSDVEIKEGDSARTTGRIVQVPVGEALVGRVVDSLGRPLDGKGQIVADRTRPVETEAPNVIERQPVKEPLQTGIKAIDAMTPIGRGQRQLVVGDRQTGKTAICVDTILNQRGEDVYCVYVAIGQKQSTVANVVDVFEKRGALEYTTVVSATAATAAPMQYLAPYASCSMAEDFRDRGKHALVVYDDLTKHAQAYRQLSLLLRRPPGREAYPGDIFYLHAHLLERAAKFSDEKGGGSLTALPIVESQLGDYAAYIPTNLISITDGQIYLESDLFFAGVRPAMNVGISVSRVGGAAQIPAMKQVAGRLRNDLAYYRELQAFTKLATELDKSTRDQLDRGERMTEVLKQPQYQVMSAAEQVVSLFAGTQGYLDDLPVERVREFEQALLAYVREQHAGIPRRIAEAGRLDDETTERLKQAILDFKQSFVGT